MVRTFSNQKSMQKSKSFHLRKMFEIPGKHLHGFFDKDSDEGGDPEKVYSKSFELRSTTDQPIEIQQPGLALNNSDHVPAASLVGEVPRMPPKPPTGIIWPLNF